MIDREKAGDVVAGWTGPRVEYLVVPAVRFFDRREEPLADDVTGIERLLDRLGAEGWKLTSRLGGGNQFVVFMRGVIDAGPQGQAGGEKAAGGQSGEAQAAGGGAEPGPYCDRY